MNDLDKVIINPKDVTDGLKIFSDVSDTQANNAIGLARLQAKGDKITDPDVFKSAVIALSKHLLYINWFNGQGGVTSANAFGNSNTIANPNVTQDEWLKQYNDLVSQYVANIHFY